MSYEEIISKIQTCSITDGDEFDLFIDDIAVAVAELNLSVSQREHLIEQLLFHVERQPDPEFTSWSLIHFIEWLDEDNSTNYNTQLLKSLKRKPTCLTLLLANRILNVLDDTSADKISFLTALKEIASDSNVDQLVRNEAKELYEYQLSKKTED
ncbi:MAG TPA: hypothetical protein VD996_17990 [Chitinophagaceae bacterium]|nr:hypothetical protein [Chitinophagaceae bacterium]